MQPTHLLLLLPILHRPQMQPTHLRWSWKASFGRSWPGGNSSMPSRFLNTALIP
ncbi:hypothetical protein TIFTF001_050752, partial [Ficus carica]